MKEKIKLGDTMKVVKMDKLHTGMIVDIFADPLTEQDKEGQAELIELLIDERHKQYWNVKFIDDRFNANRWIKK